MYLPKVSICFLFILGLSLAEEPLKFDSNGKFKLVQFTDIHFADSDSDDAKNQAILRKIIDYELPDIAVVTGDVVSGYKWDG